MSIIPDNDLEINQVFIKHVITVTQDSVDAHVTTFYFLLRVLKDKKLKINLSGQYPYCTGIVCV